MEDSHIADLEHLGDGKYIFGVFDGHGGKNHFYNNHFLKVWKLQNLLKDILLKNYLKTITIKKENIRKLYKKILCIWI